MLFVLFGFELILVAMTLLTTRMIEHKLHTIQASLGRYCNKRAYKTETDIEFIESIITSYKKLAIDTDEEPDLESAIKRRLQHEYIGKFSYVSVKNMAIRVKNLMWGVIGLEVVVVWMNQMPMSNNGQVIIVITASLLLTVIVAIYSIIKGIEEKNEALIDEVIHYVRNVYPLEQVRRSKEMAPYAKNMIHLDEHKEKRAAIKNQRVEESALQEKQVSVKVTSEEAESENLLSDQEVLAKQVKEIASEHTKKGKGQISASDIAKFLDSL